MNKAKLKILNLEVPLEDNMHYFDDGYVDSINGHTEKLLKEYNAQEKLFKLLLRKKICKVDV